jgi:16S rRNA (guanine527-N7)-methyltransferase
VNNPPDFSARLTERIQAAGLRLLLEKADLDRLDRYYEALTKWNRKINLTSLPLEGFPSRTIDRLFIESFLAAEHINDFPAVWLDLGSGGGSPAIPLKIVRPRLRLTLVESKAKKAAFLREAAHAVGLADVNVIAARIEELGAQVAPATVDLVTVRAVKLDESMWRVIEQLLRSRGRLVLFGIGSASGSNTCAGRIAVHSPASASASRLAVERNLPHFEEVVRQDLPSASGCVVVLAKI